MQSWRARRRHNFSSKLHNQWCLPENVADAGTCSEARDAYSAFLSFFARRHKKVHNWILKQEKIMKMISLSQVPLTVKGT
jgi:hypothetical protein